MINIYNTSLYQIKENSLPTSEQMPKVIVILDQPYNDLNSDLQILIQKIFKAVQINDKDIAFLTYTSIQQQGFQELVNSYSAKNVMLFGVLPKQLGWNFALSPYKIMKIKEISLLLADKLAGINIDKRKKAALWGQMKVLFQV